MAGLSGNYETPEIKPGLLEFAAALHEVIHTLKYPAEVHQKIVGSLNDLQALKTEHESVLAKNEQLFAEHRASRHAFGEEQKKAAQLHEKKAKEILDHERELQRQQNAITARETAIKKKEQEQRETAAIHAQKDAAYAERESALANRENALKTELHHIEEQKRDIKDKHEKLRQFIG